MILISGNGISNELSTNWQKFGQLDDETIKAMQFFEDLLQEQRVKFLNEAAMLNIQENNLKFDFYAELESNSQKINDLKTTVNDLFNLSNLNTTNIEQYEQKGNDLELQNAELNLENKKLSIEPQKKN
jgi:hypothetical protein